MPTKKSAKVTKNTKATSNPSSQTPTQHVVDIWTKWTNPLRNLNSYEIERLLDNARRGDDVKLQLAYYEIERSTPIFSVCISKRLSGMQNRQWAITTLKNDSDAEAQRETIQRMFEKADTRNDDGLTEALRHLDMATFRGRAVVKPFFDENGDLYFKKLDNWNVLESKGKLWWNPSSEQVFFNGLDKTEDIEQLGLKLIPKSEVIYLIDDKCLDWCGINIYLRQLIGEESWARAVEKFGIPQVLLTVPEGTPDTALDTWNWRAQGIYEGGSGALPNGSKVDVLTEARSQDPFTEFINHQMEQFSILATGGTLATLGGSTGLGSNLAEVQNEQFQSLVSYDCKRIQNAMQMVVEKCVKKVYGNDAEVKVRFEFVEQNETTPGEYLELAKKAKDLGLKVDVQKLKELTNLDFISEEEQDLWQPEQNAEDDTGGGE